MAKFAKVGYGSQGQGLGKTTDGYTYVVNDNVRTDDRIQVISTSSKGKKYPTTAVALHTYKETSAKGQEVKRETLSIMKKKAEFKEQLTGEKQPKPQITQSYTGKELGFERKGMSQQQYQQKVRQANLEMYNKQNSNNNQRETFDSYSKPFMNKD